MMFSAQRRVFRKFKKCCDGRADLRKEIERGFFLLLSEYNTSIHENRFIVGGASEHILEAALRACGIHATNAGMEHDRIDLFIDGKAGFSVKCSFTGKPDNIRLVNVLGEAKKVRWSEPTVFVLAGKGVAYADPEVLKKATTRVSDALLLKRRALNAFLESHPDCLIHLDIPTKSQRRYNTKVASEAVAREILMRKEFRLLSPPT